MNRRARGRRAEELRQLHQTVNKHADQACTLTSTLRPARTPRRARPRDLTYTLALARNLASDLDLTYLRALILIRDDPTYAHALLLARSLAQEVARALDSALAPDTALARGYAYDLEQQLEVARGRIAVMVAELAPGVDERSGSSGPVNVRPCRAAVRLSRWTVRLLPLAAQARYAEELLDELYALAEDGAGWWRQFACGLRQVVPGTWQIGVALQQERRLSRAPGQRR